MRKRTKKAPPVGVRLFLFNLSQIVLSFVFFRLGKRIKEGWRLPTLPAFQASTIGVAGLNGSVRNGKR